jgi:cysteinyl-tRNA synthetase
MALALYNTLTRQREVFVPLSPPRVTMYVCGPTVYSFAHIGNARPAVVFDVLARLLRRQFDLVYARNITDVDDKINEAARAEGVDIRVVTSRYIEAYEHDMEMLGVLPPDIAPRVTEHMPEIIDMIGRLVSRGHAYIAEAHVLFSVSSYPQYGALSRRAREDMIAGARVEVAPYKRDPADFVLWKPSPADVVGWESPWGRGRPGWHIECSTMVEAHLGDTIDIHGGGQDLVFPHHENEVAQSSCVHDGKLYSRFWIHNGFVNVDSEKMSKSLGNVLLLRDVVSRHAGEVVRLALLSTHYRQPLDWTERLLAESQAKLDRFYGVLRDAGITGSVRGKPETPPPESVVASLEEDLNTPRALTELTALARAANRTDEPRERSRIAAELRAGAWLLGLLLVDPQVWFSSPAPHGEASGGIDAAEIEALLDRREELRAAGRYGEADAIRDGLAARGIIIEDGAEGSRWRRAR